MIILSSSISISISRDDDDDDIKSGKVCVCARFFFLSPSFFFYFENIFFRVLVSKRLSEKRGLFLRKFARNLITVTSHNRERCARPRLKLVFLSLELVLFVREEHLHDVFVVFVVSGAVALVVFSA